MSPSPRSLADKLEIKESAFTAWLERELTHRADYECVETMAEFRRAAKAITRAGQIKGARGRHEKDDTRRIDDRRNFVLGWDNQAKIDALLGQASTLHRRQTELTRQHQALGASLGERQRLARTLALLGEFSSYGDIDWQSPVNRITELETEKRQLEQESDELKRINAELSEVERKIVEAERAKDTATGEIGKLADRRHTAEKLLGELEQTLAEPACEQARGLFPRLDERLARRPLATPEDCDRAQLAVGDELNAETERLGSRQNKVATEITRKMVRFRTDYPAETKEFDASIQATHEFRALHDRIAHDDLPRFETEFKTYLNTNTIRDIAGFASQLDRQADLIKQRIATINDSLIDIDYNPGRFIRLQPHPTINVEIRDFRRDLRECTAGSLGGDAVRPVLGAEVPPGQGHHRAVQGPRGPDRRGPGLDAAGSPTCATGSSSRRPNGGARTTPSTRTTPTPAANPAARRRSSPTRSWPPHWPTSSSSTGPRRSRRPSGSWSSTRRSAAAPTSRRGSRSACSAGLGLQLLIVTPLQKIHVIEPYVAAVGFVDNKTGNSSRLQTLTIEEYRQRQLAHAVEAAAVRSE